MTLTKNNEKEKMIKVDTEPCPKDLQKKKNNQKLDKNDRTLFVRFGRGTGVRDRETLRKTFADKVKEVRIHRKYKNINFVECESKDQLEDIKSQIEQMQTAGEKAVVDYMGDKGKFASRQDLKINTKKLFISGLPKSTSCLQIKKIFENCSKVTIPKSKIAGGKSYGFIFFNTESDAKAAFESGQNIKIGGALVTVVFSKEKKHETLNSNKKRPFPQEDEEENQDESPSKKQHIVFEDNEEMEVQDKEEKEEKNKKVNESESDDTDTDDDDSDDADSDEDDE